MVGVGSLEHSLSINYTCANWDDLHITNPKVSRTIWRGYERLVCSGQVWGADSCWVTAQPIYKTCSRFASYLA